mgnify:CR=1 FL=1
MARFTGCKMSGFGLRGIQERASQLGGELRLEERKGGGAQVCLSLPVGEGKEGRQGEGVPVYFV